GGVPPAGDRVHLRPAGVSPDDVRLGVVPPGLRVRPVQPARDDRPVRPPRARLRHRRLPRGELRGHLCRAEALAPARNPAEEAGGGRLHGPADERVLRLAGALGRGRRLEEQGARGPAPPATGILFSVTAMPALTDELTGACTLILECYDRPSLEQLLRARLD